MLLLPDVVFRVGLLVLLGVVVVEDDEGVCWVMSGCSMVCGCCACACACALLFVSVDDDDDKTLVVIVFPVKRRPASPLLFSLNSPISESFGGGLFQRRANGQATKLCSDGAAKEKGVSS